MCRIYRRGRIVLENTNPNRGLESNYRRPVGCAVTSLTPSVLAENLLDESEFVQTEPSPIYKAATENQFASLHEQIISNIGSHSKLSSDENSGIICGLTLMLGELDEIGVKKDKHTAIKAILDTVCKVPMLSVALGSKQELVPRNDFYFTLDQGEFKDSRNVEISCKVLVSNDQESSPSSSASSTTSSDENSIFEQKKCIKRAVSYQDDEEDSKSDTFNSALFYHTTSLNYAETFKISLPPQDLERATVLLTFAHGSNKRCLFFLTKNKPNQTKPIF